MHYSKLLRLNVWHSYKDQVLKKLGIFSLFSLLAHLGVYPNLLTLISVLSGLLSSYYLFSNHYLFSLFIFIHVLLDLLDGVYARFLHNQTRLGDVLDHGGDTIITLSLMLKTVWNFQESWMLVAPAFFIGELLLIHKFKLSRLKFPTRGIFAFFILRWYRAGMFYQIIYPIISWVVVFLLNKKNEANR